MTMTRRLNRSARRHQSRPGLALAGALALAACTHTRDVDAIPPHIVRTGDSVEITTRRGDRFTARAQAAPHGLVWRTSSGDEISWRETRTIVQDDRVLGALDGAGIGLLIGAGVGALAGASVAQDCGDDTSHCNLSIGSGVWIGAATFGLAFALVGAAAGAIKSSRVVYRVSPDRAPAF